jgi:chromosome partitioning protein
VTRIIAVANQKGGTGKTTTAVNLAAGLARGAADGRRVLLIDIDPQANATAVFLGLAGAIGPRQAGAPVIYEVLMGHAPAAEAVRTVALPPGQAASGGELYVLPAHLDLAAAEIELAAAFERERRLRQALAPLKDQYEFVIIDCPPSLGLLTLNALMAAGEVIIPLDPGIFPLTGLGLLRRTIEMVQRSNPALRISGVLPTRVDRTALARDTGTQLAGQFGTLVLPGIPQRVAVGEGHGAGQDVFAYDAGGDAARAYAAAVQAVLHRG